MTVVSGHIIQRGSPLSVSEVGEVLGTADRTLTGICRSAAVNRHARFKPYPFGGILPDGITENIIKAANFGMSAKLLDFTKLPSDNAMPTASQLAAVEQAWTQWRRPTGKQADNEPLRLGDFSGYDHLAKADIGSVTFDNQWVEGSWQALSDGWLRATVNFSEGEDFRIHLSDFSYNGTALEDMYLTLLVIKAHRYGSGGNSISWTQKYFAAQSSQTLKQLRPTGSATVEIDLSKVSDGVIAEFSANENYSSSSDHIVALGIAPKMDGLADGFGVPQLIHAAGALPQLISLNMYDSPLHCVRYSSILGTAEQSGAVDKEFFEVGGHLEVAQNTAYGKTAASWATVDGQRGIMVRVGGQFSLMPLQSAQDSYPDRGRFKLDIIAVAKAADGTTVSDSRVIVTPVGIQEYVVAVNNGTVDTIKVFGQTVSTGPSSGANDATLKFLDGGIFLPFAGNSATVTVRCSTEGYPTGNMYGKQYWPLLKDQGGNFTWDAELLNTNI